MTVIKKLTTLLLVLLMLLPGLPVQAAEESTDQLVRQLINYFHYYQDEARLDCELLLEQIEAQDPALAATWTNILEFWTGVNGDMSFHTNSLPDGLPEDNSLCIVIMGYYLKSDGSMRDELYQRLRVALDAANKYPNAYILCTGGGTGSSNRKVTEASQMAKWLEQKGIAPNRIIVENQARSTIENATYGCELLYRDYPQIQNLVIVTSDYHIYRSCLYFHVQAALEAYKTGTEPMKVISNAACRVDPGAARDLDRQVEGVGMLTDLDLLDMPQPELTYLERITVEGQSEYSLGAQLDLSVTAHYSNGYIRDVTANAEFFNCNMDVAGSQIVRACYDELIETFEIHVIAPQPQPEPTQATSVSVTPSEPLIPAETTVPNEPDHLLLYVCLVLILLLFILLYAKRRQTKKHRRRPRPTIKLD